MFPWGLSDDFSELVKDGYKDTDLSNTIGKLTWVALGHRSDVLAGAALTLEGFR